MSALRNPLKQIQCAVVRLPLSRRRSGQKVAKPAELYDQAKSSNVFGERRGGLPAKVARRRVRGPLQGLVRNEPDFAA